MDTTEREELLKVVEEINNNADDFKIIYIDKTSWYNAITGNKQVVRDLFFFGRENSSQHIFCINTLSYKRKKYKIHSFISHTNMNGNIYNAPVTADENLLEIEYQEFCSPITGYHLFTIDGIENIIKGQLMGQNNNSAFQTVSSVTNDGYDAVVRNNRGQCLRAKSSPLELLTRCSSNDRNDFIERLNVTTLPQKGQLAVKPKSYDCYTTIAEKDFESQKERLSNYYPVITPEQCEDLLANIPKMEYDFTVIGLGSAGTGILDQVVRSTYFNNYYLIDFDDVERKNLRNQWYTKTDVCSKKTTASKGIINKITEARDVRTTINTRNFKNIDFSRIKSKYVVSGFDNLECRMELLERALNSFEVRYLIDLRYLDYSCSIYFIDLKDESQVKYYRNLLQADIDAFKGNERIITTEEELMDYWKRQQYFYKCCDSAREKFFNWQQPCPCHGCGCESDRCKEWLWERFQEAKPRIVVEEESSCVRENFIDIYKYASCFVFSAIREIEGDNGKPFTHIEAQTDVIPTNVIVKV